VSDLAKVSWYLVSTACASAELLAMQALARSWYAWLNGLMNLVTVTVMYLGTFWI
jgi:hypothetical protein